MPARHVNIIVLTACISFLCYVVHRRTKTALLVGDAISMIDSYYVDPVDSDQLVVSAMNGITQSLDDHSEFIAEQNYQAFQDSIQQEFAGIGIYVEQPEEGQPVRVITPLVSSPALTAGILPGDQILTVEGEDVAKMALQDVSQRLKGPVGTSISIGLLRNAQKVELNVTRERIEIESVIGDHRDSENKWVYRLADRPDIAYLRITSFGDKTVEEITTALSNLKDDYLGLILDLRGNGGGLLNSAVDISDMFISEGRIVSTRTRGGVLEDQFDAEQKVLVKAEKPIAVLIDQDSASASEILAACLQDHERATVVGKRSFGKGTVQNVLPLQYGRSALRLTVARYYRPNGKNIHRKRGATEDEQWGVSPDEGFDVDLDPTRLEQLAKRWRESSYPSLAQPKPMDAALQDGTNRGEEAYSSSSEELVDPGRGSENTQDDNSSLSEERLDTQLWAAVDAIDGNRTSNER